MNQLLNPEEETHLFMPEDIQANKGKAMTAGIPFLFWVPLVAKEESAFVRFYGNQGLILFLLYEAFKIGGKILFPFLRLIPAVGWIIVLVLKILRFVIVAAGTILLLVSAKEGRAVRLPLVGRLVDMFH